MASGAMISSGLFVLPGIIYARAGAASYAVYLLAGLCMIPAMLCKAELATAMPKAGGTYFFIDRSLGAALGSMAGFSSWISLALKSAFALVGVGAFMLAFFPSFPEWGIRITGAAVCLILTMINLRGARHAGNVQKGLVGGLLTILALFIVMGIPHVDPANFHSAQQTSWASILGATGMVFVSYGGLTKIASMAEEVDDPGKTLPLGMVLSFLVVTPLYVMVVATATGVMGKALNGDLNPLISCAHITLGSWGYLLVALAAMFAYISTGNAGILAASRVPMAMSRDDLLPEELGEINAASGIPVRAVWMTTGFMLVAILFLQLEVLVKVASTMMILLFMLECLAVILMRESRLENYQPSFRVWYPYLPAAGLAIYFLLLLNMGLMPLLLTGFFFLGGLMWYILYGRIRVNRESALIRIARRAMPHEISNGTLNGELREILRMRDGMVEDRFDRLLRECPLLDMRDANMSMGDVFARVAETMAPLLGVSEEYVLEALLEREAESSTVLKPGLAIPHILIAGHDKFAIIPVRLHQGVIFEPDVPPVHACFVLAGTADWRNFHLRVLMYIAQITQNPHFEERWLSANREESLRDILLLSKRTRENAGDSLLS